MYVHNAISKKAYIYKAVVTQEGAARRCHTESAVFLKRAGRRQLSLNNNNNATDGTGQGTTMPTSTVVSKRKAEIRKY